ncbi:single-stranded-DNA-specific exonuclease RecJ [Lactobacillus sp. DCY120]|uniref:Single-stranded-DNA-specific exonuclease RecJ n=1 Tax=Bombilactobacillus apium TaxID=2675299 RepID=A0A850RCM3_9LACO|nr:single-stranded-DNA-specific exonuclease RecJ [Bombilactobacillus apium]NVY97046.1 single-stranded-DNA-specific exonuclease RecJ [Bombilactobacillus apium]
MGLAYQWQPGPSVQVTHQTELAQSLNLPVVLVQLLAQRGLTEEEQIRDFLEPKIEDLHDPYQLHDLDQAVQRIQTAISEKQKMIVYGDYDADGITSTTIMWTAIKKLGGIIDYYVPDRFKDGYGPNLQRYQEFVAAGYQLIITVDNGVTGVEEVAYAQSQGVDVVITDHHNLPVQLPKAVAIVHPQHPDQTYPCPYLAGAGVAFKVASALWGRVPQELLDLAAIGTIADVVELEGENRTLVALGLQQMRQEPRLGLSYLCKKASVQLASLSEEDIGFQIAPRLNALGRLDQASKGVALLSSSDPDQAQALATEIEHLNRERKTMTQEVLTAANEQAQAQLEQGAKVLVIAGHGWHQGILGIVAGRILQASQCPTLILNIDSQGAATGSGRSREDFDLYQALCQFRESFTKFGGHPQACGITLEEKEIEPLRQNLNRLPQAQALEQTEYPKRQYDLELPLNQVTLEFYQQLQRLAPFGQSNPQPRFKITHFQQANVQYLGKKSQDHLKITLRQHRQYLDSVGFGQGEWVPRLQASGLHAVYGTLMANHWRRQTRLQVNLADVEPFATQQVYLLPQTKQRWLDLRQTPASIWTQTPGNFLFFREHNLQEFQKLYPQASCYPIEQAPVGLKKSLIIDRPHNLDTFQDFWQRQADPELAFVFQTKNLDYYQNLPEHDQWQQCLKYFWSHQNLHLTDLETLSNYLALTSGQLNSVLAVFSELNFVKITNGVLTKPTAVKTCPLASSKTYRHWEQLTAVQNKLINSNFTEMVAYLEALGK